MLPCVSPTHSPTCHSARGFPQPWLPSGGLTGSPKQLCSLPSMPFCLLDPPLQHTGHMTLFLILDPTVPIYLPLEKTTRPTPPSTQLPPSFSKCLRRGLELITPVPLGQASLEASLSVCCPDNQACTWQVMDSLLLLSPVLSSHSPSDILSLEMCTLPRVGPGI